MIGSNLVKRLVEDHEVIVLDNLWRGKIENVDKRSDFVKVDLSIPRSLDSFLDGVDYVFHLADVVAGIGYVFNHEPFVFHQNVLINTNVADSIRRLGGHLKGYIYVGTACSFPHSKQNGTPLKETDQFPAMPESAYGWSKLMGEYEALLLEKHYKIPVSVLSLHNVYGSPCDTDIVLSQVIPALIRKAINDDEMVVYGSGKQGRAFVHVDDVVRALITAMSRGLGRGVVQIGPDHCTLVSDLAEKIVALSGRELKIRYDTTMPEGDFGRCADYTKAREVLGWEPKVSLDEGLERLYRWMTS